MAGWLSVAALLLVWSLVGKVSAAEPVKIGVLTDSWGPTPATIGLRDGLMALGYRDGDDFVIGTRFTQGDPKALAPAARDLLRAGSNVLFASGTNSAKAAQAATGSIPIVFAEAMSDPIAAGLVKSLARPGGNITGVTDLWDDLGPKRLQIFKEMLPALRRVILIYNADDESHGATMLRQNREAARQLGITLVERPVRNEAEARTAAAVVRKGEDGLMGGSTTSFNISGIVLDATAQHRVPTMFPAVYWTERGALASYGPDFYESGRQAARLVDKIIKGQKPADIPVEANPRIDLVINLKVARALGLSIAPTVLQRATRVIE